MRHSYQQLETNSVTGITPLMMIANVVDIVNTSTGGLAARRKNECRNFAYP